jgi:hypothetical protein
MTVGDSINIVLAGATVLMATGTFYLAIVTRRLSLDTAEGIKQANRHHQEDSRPFCVLAFTGATDLHPFGAQFDPQDRQQTALMSRMDNTLPHNALVVRGDLHNKGKGPAQRVLLYFNTRRGDSDGDAYRLTRSVVVSWLIAGGESESIDIHVTEQDIIRTRVGTELRPTQVFHALAGETYEVVLEYEDAFGNAFRTVHSRALWSNNLINVSDQSAQIELMVRQNRPTPRFLVGREVVRTLADLPGQLSPMPQGGNDQI